LVFRRGIEGEKKRLFQSVRVLFSQRDSRNASRWQASAHPRLRT
jgi:hypothetical protein